MGNSFLFPGKIDRCLGTHSPFSHLKKIVIFTTFFSVGRLSPNGFRSLFKYVHIHCSELVYAVRSGVRWRGCNGTKYFVVVSFERAGYATNTVHIVAENGTESITALIKHLLQPINRKDDGILMRTNTGKRFHDMQRFVDFDIIQKFSIFSEDEAQRYDARFPSNIRNRFNMHICNSSPYTLLLGCMQRERVSEREREKRFKSFGWANKREAINS